MALNKLNAPKVETLSKPGWCLLSTSGYIALPASGIVKSAEDEIDDDPDTLMPTMAFLYSCP